MVVEARGDASIELERRRDFTGFPRSRTFNRAKPFLKRERLDIFASAQGQTIDIVFVAAQDQNSDHGFLKRKNLFPATASTVTVFWSPTSISHSVS